MKKTSNIFLGFYDTAGVFSGLQNVFSEMGEYSRCYLYTSHQFSYSDYRYLYFTIIRFFYNYAYSRNFITRIVSKLLFNVFSLPFFVYVLIKFDTYILTSKSFFFFNIFDFEFKVLKFFKKKVLFVFTGTDSRPPFLSGINYALDSNVLISRTLEKIQFLNRSKFKDFKVVDLPSTALFHTGRVIDFFKIGFPKKMVSLKPRKFDASKRLRVLHAPSFAEFKGSHVFRETIQKLKQKIDFDYIEISNLSNAEVLKEIENADLVIDELYSDSLMAGIATEAAWLGTCYVVFGERLAEMAEIYGWPCRNFEKPINHEVLLEKMLSDHDLRYETACSLHSFVTTNWNVRDVATRFLNAATGCLSEEYIIDPVEIALLNRGWGASENKIIAMLEKLKFNKEIQPYLKRLE